MSTHCTNDLTDDPMGHLTDEQFADLLAGDTPTTVVEAHLSTCETCRTEVASLTRAAAEFNALSFAWAQAEAPRRIVPPTRFQRLLAQGGPVWALSLTTALLIGIVSTHIPMPFGAEQKVNSAAATATQSAPRELAADNRLMQSIADELQYSSQPAVPVNELRVSARRIVQPRTAPVEN